MSKYMNIQDAVLDECIKNKIPVTMYMVNGFQFRGLITGKDNFVIVFENDGKQQMVYKHAISTVSPIRPLNCLKKL